MPVTLVTLSATALTRRPTVSYRRPMLNGELGSTILGVAGAIAFEERIRRLEPLRLARRQTEFVVTVALHGGYCLQRQYDAFVSRSHGQVACDFFDRLIAERLATRIQIARHRGYIYHLRAKGLYRALGQEDNRNRRSTSAAQIARKLMVLDYVLATESREWLATEQDKVAVLTNRLKVPALDLPQRHFRSRDRSRAPTDRYFLNKLPIRVRDGDSRVEFVYLVLDKSGAGLETFLKDHARLLRRLRCSTIICICSREFDGLPACRRVFPRALETMLTSGNIEFDRDDLQWFFRKRPEVDRNDLRAFSIADLDRYRELREQFATEEFERLFRSWQALGDGALIDDERRRDNSPPPQVNMVEYTLPFAYEQFGSWPGLA